MEHETGFIEDLNARAAGQCQCERAGCHPTEGRCTEPLVEGIGAASWSTVRVTANEAYPPDAADYLAICGPCGASWEAARLPKRTA